MEAKTITNVRMQLAKAVLAFSEAKYLYKSERLEKPFDKSNLDQWRHHVNLKHKDVQNLRAELESYQLEFLFGA